MPTYTYVCTDCDEHLEVVQSFTSDPLTECPRCGGTLRKVFHPVGVLFKGSGFYRTDSRASSKPAAKTPADAGSSGSDAGASAPGGSKPASTGGSSTTSGSGSAGSSSAGSSSGGSSRGSSAGRSSSSG